MNRDTLRTVIAESRNEIPGIKIIQRDFAFESFGNYVFVGIRRAGKSYLLYQRIQQLLAQGKGWDELLYVNFEDERLSDMTTQDLNLLLDVHYETSDKKPILFLDEIQNIPYWEKFARRLADTKHRVYITGSNAKMLSSEIQTTLGGRYIAVDVYPYDFREYCDASGVKRPEATLLFATRVKAALLRAFNGYMDSGGFPESVGLTAKRDYLTSVYQKVFLGDIVARHAVDNVRALRVMLKKLAESVGQPLSLNRIAHVVSSTGAKVGTTTVTNYIGYAIAAWLVTPVRNIAGKMVEKETNPKYYFTDNGLLNLFLIDGRTALLENAVAMQLLRKYRREDAVFFYSHNAELDFYIPDTSTAIQVCYDLDADADTFKRETESLLAAASRLSCKRRLIITHADERTLKIKNQTIHVLPAWKWMMGEKEI
jgi:predicted AAA+ superfamily ATPase